MAHARLTIPEAGTATLEIGGREVRLTNLEKPFWPEDGITKGDLIQYYADVAALLLPHVRDRAMVMKRYPHGAGGDFFFMKRAPVPRPAWLRTCSIEHESGNVIDFPVVEDVASLLWVINLGCIDLNQWYATCDDVDRPDYLHFDLDPGEGATWDRVLACGRIVRDALETLKMRSVVKTTGSKGLHVYVPIKRGPGAERGLDVRQGTCRRARGAASSCDDRRVQSGEASTRSRAGRLQPECLGTHARVRVSVRPRPRAPVSTPVTWDEIDRGVRIEDFRLDNVRTRFATTGDLWKPLLQKAKRVDLRKYLA